MYPREAIYPSLNTQNTDVDDRSNKISTLLRQLVLMIETRCKYLTFPVQRETQIRRFRVALTVACVNKYFHKRVDIANAARGTFCKNTRAGLHNRTSGSKLCLLALRWS